MQFAPALIIFILIFTYLEAPDTLIAAFGAAAMAAYNRYLISPSVCETLTGYDTTPTSSLGNDYAAASSSSTPLTSLPSASGDGSGTERQNHNEIDFFDTTNDPCLKHSSSGALWFGRNVSEYCLVPMEMPGVIFICRC